MARAAAAGRRVVCVTATAGEAGFPDDDPHPPDERIAVRRAEMEASPAELGVTEHHWPGYGDGHCADVPDDDAVEVLGRLIADDRPDTVLTFSPDGGTGHSDHIAACRRSTLACTRSSSPPRLLYATKSPEWIAAFFSQIDATQIMMVDGMRPEVVPTTEWRSG